MSDHAFTDDQARSLRVQLLDAQVDLADEHARRTRLERAFDHRITDVAAVDRARAVTGQGGLLEAHRVSEVVTDLVVLLNALDAQRAAALAAVAKARAALDGVVPTDAVAAALSALAEIPGSPS